MKTAHRFTFHVSRFTILALLLSSALAARAGEYGPVATVWSASSITNATGVATNVAGVVPVRQTGEFTLQVVLAFTNAAAGTYDVQWTTSADNLTYTTAPAAPGASGWFSIPLTNGGTTVTWLTNISVASRGYWKLNWGTNQAGQSLTNASIAAYVKPKRTNQDY